MPRPPNTSKNTSNIVREYSVWELEDKAQALLARVFPSGLTIPIEVEEVAFRLGLEINPIPGLNDAHQVAGTLWKDFQDHYWIVVDEYTMDHREARHRFTVAEEIAHFALHKEYVVAVIRDITAQQRAKDELTGHVCELENFYKAAVGRENGLVELKKQVNQLCRELGKPELHNLSFLDSGGAEP